MPEQDLNTKQILSEKWSSQNERLFLDFKLYYKKMRNQETFRNKFILGLLYNHTWISVIYDDFVTRSI